MRIAFALFCLAALPASAVAQWTFDAEAWRMYDDNLSRAQRESDIVGDRALTLRGALGRLFVVGGGDLALRAEARAARYDNYSGLDYYALGAGAGWRRKLGLGLTAPWIAADGAVFQEAYEESIRDGRRASLSLTLGKRFAERVEASLTAAYDRRSQRNDVPSTRLSGRPFSLQGRSVFLKGSFALAEPVLLFGAAGVRRGDVVSSTRRNLQIFRESSAIANDPAFGPDFVAYRLTGARTESYSLGVSWALGRRASIDASVGADRTHARGALDYDGNVYAVTLVYRD